MANLQSFERTDYQQVKADLHRKILDRLDLEKLGKATGDSAREEVLIVIRNAVNAEVVPLSFAERERLSREILDEIFGLGPLEPLLKDPTISDILVNRFDRVYVERAGKLERTALTFKDNSHLMQIIERIVSRIGRRAFTRALARVPPSAIEHVYHHVRRTMIDVAWGDAEHERDPDLIAELIAQMESARAKRAGREGPKRPR